MYKDKDLCAETSSHECVYRHQGQSHVVSHTRKQIPLKFLHLSTKLDGHIYQKINYKPLVFHIQEQYQFGSIPEFGAHNGRKIYSTENFNTNMIFTPPLQQTNIAFTY